MAPRKTPHQSTPPKNSVEGLLAALDHPNKSGILLLRKAILASDARIREEVKWNAPSFMLSDHFATFKLHPPGPIQLVLHTGAKPVRPPRQFVLKNTGDLVKWAAPDRCILYIGDNAAAKTKLGMVVDLVSQWANQVHG